MTGMDACRVHSRVI